MHETEQQEYLNELSPQLRPRIARVLNCECGGKVLDFFRHRQRVWLQITDIAYYLHQRPDQTEAALDLLVDEGIIERSTVLNAWTFYGLCQHPDIVQLLEQFWAWRDRWTDQVEQVRYALQLPTNVNSSSLAL